jgi:hypothetical protein
MGAKYRWKGVYGGESCKLQAENSKLQAIKCSIRLLSLKRSGSYAHSGLFLSNIHQQRALPVAIAYGPSALKTTTFNVLYQLISLKGKKQ